MTKGDTTTVSYKQVFDYGRFGNLFRKTASNPTSGQESPLPYTAIESGDIDPAKNRFTSGTGTAYDDKGQVVTDNKFRALGLAYDANGRMVVASQANTPDAVSVYDALGNRVAEKVNDVWQFVIYDAFGNIVAEYGGISAQDEGGVKYYLQDWQGSVRAGVNAGGYVKSRTDHQAFGEDIESGVGLRTTAQGFGAPQANRQGYGLTEKDSATGLNHTWFRKNENRAGRWTSPDPYNGSASVGNPQSWNRYSYVESQPTNFVDPSGLFIYIGPPAPPMPMSPWELCYRFGICGNPPPPPTTGGDPGLPGGGGGGGGGESEELSPCVKDLLKKFFPKLDLNRVRVVNGRPWFIPSTTTAGTPIGGITIGNNIYTSTTEDFQAYLGATWGALEFIAHELTHVDQYRRLGVSIFLGGYAIEGAYAAATVPASEALKASYKKNAFETRARNNAARIIRKLQQAGAGTCPINVGTISTVNIKG